MSKELKYLWDIWPLGKIQQFLVVTVLTFTEDFAFCCQSEEETVCFELENGSRIFGLTSEMQSS